MSTTSTARTTRRVRVAADDGAWLAAWIHEPAPEPSSGAPTVVLAHGWTVTHQAWARVVRALQDRVAVRVVTYDQRGHGESQAHGPGRRHPAPRSAPSVRTSRRCCGPPRRPARWCWAGTPWAA